MEKKKEAGENRSSSRDLVEENPLNISGRILNSASGLLRDSLSPNGNRPASTLVGALASESKAGPSSSSASTERGTASELVLKQNASRGLGPYSCADEAFREPSPVVGNTTSRSAKNAERVSLDQFMYGIQDDNDAPTWQYTSVGKGKQAATSLGGYHADPPTLNMGFSAAWEAVACSEPAQELQAISRMEAHGTEKLHKAACICEDDGADVVKLLQDSESSSWTEMLTEQDGPYTISQDDMRIAEELVRHIDRAMNSKPSSKAVLAAASSGQLPQVS